jgi:hypothetical protein
MKKLTFLLTLLFSLPSFAENYDRGDIIIGHIWFDQNTNSDQVAAIGKQILKDDTHFSSMAVVGTGRKEWGLYFRYNKNENMKTNSEFSKFYQEKIKKTPNFRGKYGISCSDGVTVLK